MSKKAGDGRVTHLNRMIWFGVAMAAVKLIESIVGHEMLDDEQRKQVAEILISLGGIIAAVLAQRAMKPAVIQAADAQGVDEVAMVKTEAKVTPAEIEAAEPKVNLGVIKAAGAQGEKEVAQARGASAE